MKRLLAILLAMCMLLSLAACGEPEDEDDKKPNKTKPSATETGGKNEPTDPEVPGTEEATRNVWLATEMAKTVHDEYAGPQVYREVYTYDLQGNLVSRVSYTPSGQVSSSVTMEYDADGHMIKEIFKSGNVYEYAYDALGNQFKIVGDEGQTYTLELDDQGRALRYQDPYSTDVYTYAEDMTSYTVTSYNEKGQATQYTEYTLDEKGHVVMTRRCGMDGKLRYRTDFVYENDLLVQELYYELGSETYVSTSHTYTYDAYGNRLTDHYDGNYYSPDYDVVYTITEVTVTESAAQRLGQ